MVATVQSNRIISIDLLRGFVMAIMALDHTRDFFHYSLITLQIDALDPASTTPWMYASRWVTHLCAPTFVWLAGISAWLHAKKSKMSVGEKSRFLGSRGLWLIVLELSIINFGWTFNPTFSNFYLIVIWAIGASMILLAIFSLLPRKWHLPLALAIIFGHNFFDGLSFEKGTTAYVFETLFIHTGRFEWWGRSFRVPYPVLPWFGIMLLGYSMGHLFTQEAKALRHRVLWLGGLFALVMCVVLRLFTVYGDPRPFEKQPHLLWTIYDFLNMSKYPPSLHFSLMFLGLAMLLLYAFELFKTRANGLLVVFGGVPLFFYVLHIYLLHALNLLMYVGQRGHISGIDWEKGVWGYEIKFGYGLLEVYLIWLGLLAVCYPLCKRFAAFKAKHSSKWWVSYI
jgi:uncharacterized membrane protein